MLLASARHTTAAAAPTALTAQRSIGCRCPVSAPGRRPPAPARRRRPLPPAAILDFLRGSGSKAAAAGDKQQRALAVQRLLGAIEGAQRGLNKGDTPAVLEAVAELKALGEGSNTTDPRRLEATWKLLWTTEQVHGLLVWHAGSHPILLHASGYPRSKPPCPLPSILVTCRRHYSSWRRRAGLVPPLETCSRCVHRTAEECVRGGCRRAAAACAGFMRRSCAPRLRLGRPPPTLPASHPAAPQPICVSTLWLPAGDLLRGRPAAECDHLPARGSLCSGLFYQRPGTAAHCLPVHFGHAAATGWPPRGAAAVWQGACWPRGLGNG